MARYKSKGWRRESLRHSRARKYGRAGGKYANDNWRYPKDVFSDKKSFVGISKSNPEFKKEAKEHPSFSDKQVKQVVIDHNKNKSFYELKKEGIFLPYQGDADKDGVKNIKDCKPLHPKKTR
jgi:hypothetical protein